LVTVAFSGYDELLGDIGFLGTLGGNPQLAKAPEAMLVLATQGKGLAGLDKSKPWGLVVQTDGQQFPVVGFVPVTDLKQLLDVLTPLVGPPEDAGNGVLKVQPGADAADDGGMGMAPQSKPVFIKQQGGWALIADSPEALAAAPADPTQALDGLEKKYDLALKASVKNIPAPMREMAILQLKAGTDMFTAQRPGESDDDYAIRTGMTKQAIDQFITTVNDLDEVLVGWALDQNTGTSYFDFELTAVEGTKTAAQFAQMEQATTNFAGFDLPGAALTANWAGKIPDTDVAQAKSTIANIRKTAVTELDNQGLSANDVQLATRLINDLLDVVEKTIEGKKSDGGAVLLLDSSAATFVAGGKVAEGAKLEGVVKQLAQMAAKDQPEFAQAMKLDAETHAGVRFHTLAFPVPPGEAEATKVFGDTLDIVVGIGDESVYLAGGSDAAATLKSVIDKSQAELGKQVDPLRISLAAAPIAKFVSENMPDDDQGKMMATMLAGQLATSAGKDHLTVTSKPIPNGASMRLEIEEGLLKLIAVGAQMAQQQMMSGGGPPPGAAPF